MVEIRHYLTDAGRNPFMEWLDALAERSTQARIAARINRLAAGNFGDAKFLRTGVWELRIDHGPGYRVYFGRMGQTVVLLLGGGDKRRQSADIVKAIMRWQDYQRRSQNP